MHLETASSRHPSATTSVDGTAAAVDSIYAVRSSGKTFLRPYVYGSVEALIVYRYTRFILKISKVRIRTAFASLRYREVHGFQPMFPRTLRNNGEGSWIYGR